MDKGGKRDREEKSDTRPARGERSVEDDIAGLVFEDPFEDEFEEELHEEDEEDGEVIYGSYVYVCTWH
jgi:hypothetical protein